VATRRVLLWDVASRRVRARLTGHTEAVTVLAFARDGRTSVSRCKDGTIRWWDTTMGEVKRVTSSHSGTVLSAAFSPDGRTLATVGNHDPDVRFWDMATGLERMSLHGSAEMAVPVVFAPDGATLAASDCRGELTLWDIESGRAHATWEAHGGWV
jgi:WD40 repeat protein